MKQPSHLQIHWVAYLLSLAAVLNAYYTEFHGISAEVLAKMTRLEWSCSCAHFLMAAIPVLVAYATKKPGVSAAGATPDAPDPAPTDLPAPALKPASGS